MISQAEQQGAATAKQAHLDRAHAATLWHLCCHNLPQQHSQTVDISLHMPQSAVAHSEHQHSCHCTSRNGISLCNCAHILMQLCTYPYATVHNVTACTSDWSHIMGRLLLIPCIVYSMVLHEGKRRAHATNSDTQCVRSGPPMPGYLTDLTDQVWEALSTLHHTLSSHFSPISISGAA